MKRVFPLLVAIVLAAPPASAAILFESGTLGTTGVPWQDALDGLVPGSSVDSVTFSGVRFQLTQPVVTTQVGGHFFSPASGSFFGAIVELNNGTDFPDSEDLSTPDVLGNTLLTFPVNSAEAFGDLALSLDPGWYALVYGSGLFGADGSGGMPLNNPDIRSPTYIAYQLGTGWLNLIGLPIPFDDYRFIIQGSIVPEPTSIVIGALGYFCLLFRRRS